MSLPVAGPIAAVAMSPFDGFLHVFNSNPYFIGIMMLLLNLGGRFIGMEITKQQEQFLQHPWVRRLLIFTVLFMGTRSIKIAFWSTIAVVLVLGYLFNENSAMCIFGKGGAAGATCNEPAHVMSVDEKEILHRLRAKEQRSIPSVTLVEEADVSHNDIYAANMSLLRKGM